VTAAAPLEQVREKHGGVDARRIVLYHLAQKGGGLFFGFRSFEKDRGLFEPEAAPLGDGIDERQRFRDEPDERLGGSAFPMDLEKWRPDVAVRRIVFAQRLVNARGAVHVIERTHRGLGHVEEERATVVGGSFGGGALRQI